jgi:hypothetical protein
VDFGGNYFALGILRLALLADFVGLSWLGEEALYFDHEIDEMEVFWKGRLIPF